jgi:hypothetical protein
MTCRRTAVPCARDREDRFRHADLGRDEKMAPEDPSVPEHAHGSAAPGSGKGWGRLVISATWRSDRLASFAEGADEGSLGLPAECASARRAGMPGLAAHAGCYLVGPFLAARPFPAPSSGFMASSRLSANFRWEMSSCSAKS